VDFGKSCQLTIDWISYNLYEIFFEIKFFGMKPLASQKARVFVIATAKQVINSD